MSQLEDIFKAGISKLRTQKNNYVLGGRYSGLKVKGVEGIFSISYKANLQYNW